MANSIPTAQTPTAAENGAVAAPSLVRSWFFLVWLSMVRQARMRYMVWTALGLLGFTVTFVGIFTIATDWNLRQRRWMNYAGQVYTYGDATNYNQAIDLGMPRSGLTPQWEQAVLASAQATLDRSSFYYFVQAIVLAGPSIVLNFLLPIWSLSFATDSLGGDRENRSLIWLLTRPLPRPLVYLAKFVAVLPWTLGLNVGGFGVICLAGGRPGREAFVVLWPAVCCGTFAFSALFLLIGMFFRRPAVVAIVYSFFLEVVLGNMPGFFKRASISFYTRCMMYQAVAPRGIGPRQPEIFLAVDGSTAFVVLAAATVALLVIGMVVFSRVEYHEGS